MARRKTERVLGIVAGVWGGRRGRTALLALALALPVGVMIDRILVAGPLALRPAATVATNAHPALRPVEPYLIFLAAVRNAVPEGSPIRILAPEAPTGNAPMNYLIAVGQLPRHRVLPSTSPVRGEYVAAYAVPSPADVRFVLRVGAGMLVRNP